MIAHVEFEARIALPNRNRSKVKRTKKGEITLRFDAGAPSGTPSTARRVCFALRGEINWIWFAQSGSRECEMNRHWLYISSGSFIISLVSLLILFRFVEQIRPSA